jgi:hypothetical protein
MYTRLNLAMKRYTKYNLKSVVVRHVCAGGYSWVEIRVLVDFGAVLSGSSGPSCEARSCSDELAKYQIHQWQ